MLKFPKLLVGIHTLVIAGSLAIPVQAAIKIGGPTINQSPSVVTINTNQNLSTTVPVTSPSSAPVTQPASTSTQNPVTSTPVTNTPSTGSSVVSLKGLINTANTANTAVPITTTPANSPTVTTTSSTTTTSGTIVIPTTLTSDEQSMINMINQERSKNGLQALKIDFRLVAAARIKAQDMKDNKYFSHVSPTFGYTASLYPQMGLKVNYWSENIAGNKSVSGAMTAFMASPGHRTNILDPNINCVGVGIVYNSVFGNLYVQNFTRE